MTRGCLTAGRSRPSPAAEFRLGRRQLLRVQPAEAGGDGRPGGLDVVFHIRANRRQDLGRPHHILKLRQKRLQPLRRQRRWSGRAGCASSGVSPTAPCRPRRWRWLAGAGCAGGGVSPTAPCGPRDGSSWPALAAQAAASPQQRPVDSGDGGDWTALAAQAAAVGTVAKDCKDAVSTRRLAAGSTNSLWLRKKSTPIMANVTSARRNVHSNRRPWKSSCTALSPQHGIRWPPAPVRSSPLGGDVER